MNSVAALLACNNKFHLSQTLAGLQQYEMIKTKAVVVPSNVKSSESDLTTFCVSSLWSKAAILDSLKWFIESKAAYLFVISPGVHFINPEGLQRMITCMRDTQASIVYGDYYEIRQDRSMRIHPLIDYQPGSIRDSFDFGQVILLNGVFLENIHKVIEKTTPKLTYGGLYDLRLRLLECANVYHLPEPMYCSVYDNQNSDTNGHFAYVDPRNRDYQLEMEKIATAYLQRIGAFINPPQEELITDKGNFPVKASIIIPVKNRVRTISEAVKSALSQSTSFTYNVIVIDNHSTDGTTDLLAEIAHNDTRLVHHIPKRTDLLIGGCWNEAIYSHLCGMYAIQLDSDDMYNGPEVLERVITEFSKKPYALVIGSYTTVNFDLKPLAPGLVDHREWTEANGPNNALRIAGLGAPRAYHVPTLRQFGFPNASYGEDYAVVLRLCRSYPVGRIYDSLYWCRRWEDNSDNELALEIANKYDFYKDRLRTVEIAARIGRRKEGCS